MRYTISRHLEWIHNRRTKAGVHRDIAAEDALQTAICDGVLLANRIREEIASVSACTKVDYTKMCSIPLSEIDDEERDETPGSYLNTACVGAVMALNIASLYGNVNGGQDRVMHFTLTKALADWEVGEEKAGYAPFPFLKDGSHIYYSPDTLKGGRFSLAHDMMQRCRRVGGGGKRKKRAQGIAEILMGDFDLTPASFERRGRWTPRLADAPLPESTIQVIAKAVMLIPPFWPDYLNGRRLTW